MRAQLIRNTTDIMLALAMRELSGESISNDAIDTLNASIRSTMQSWYCVHTIYDMRVKTGLCESLFVTSRQTVLYTL